MRKSSEVSFRHLAPSQHSLAFTSSQPSQPSIVSLIDDASINFYNASSAMQPSGNLMISPVSILYCTILAYLGSRGSTKSNMYSALHFNKAFADEDTDVAGAFGELMGQYKTSATSSRSPSPGRSGRKGPSERSRRQEEEFQLTLANGIFLQQTVKLHQKYQDTVTRELKAGVTKANFIKESDKARKDVNQWVLERTGGKIKDLIPSGAVTSDTIAILANAVYFKAQWKHVFDSYHSKNDSFALLNGKKSTATFMNIRKNFNYTEDRNLDVQYVEVPYSKDEASMLIILPRDPKGLRQLERSLTPEKLRGLANSVRRKSVQLTLPRFKMDYTVDLKELLGRLGVSDMFSPNDADFSDMTPDVGTYVSDAFHKTFIAVDEKGTEAAAASAMVMMSRFAMIELEEPVEVKVDHPFIFAIRHNPSQTILFYGRLENPK